MMVIDLYMLLVIWSCYNTPVISVSLKVNPDRSDFFPSESISLSCEDDHHPVVGWTVRRESNKTEDGGTCGSEWGSTEGVSCVRTLYQADNGVYWCQSESERSRSINITISDVILQSPVLPVPEGDKVTFRCLYKDKTSGNPSSDLPAGFYLNGSFIRTESTGQMTIHHVIKSDEGFYNCNISGRGESPEKWMEVIRTSRVIGSSQPVMAKVGDDVILPCHIEPPVDMKKETVEWTRPDLKPQYVHMLQDGHVNDVALNPLYIDRTSLFPEEELSHGNVSLKLTRVQLSDEGKYTCLVPGPDRSSEIQLLVGAVSQLKMTFLGIKGKFLSWRCDSGCWFPEPEMSWLDSDGNNITAEPSVTEPSDHCYVVQRNVTVKQGGYVTCRVHLPHINHTVETHSAKSEDDIPTEDQPTSQRGFIAFIILLVAAILGFVCWKWREEISSPFRKWFRPTLQQSTPNSSNTGPGVTTIDSPQQLTSLRQPMDEEEALTENTPFIPSSTNTVVCVVVSSAPPPAQDSVDSLAEEKETTPLIVSSTQAVVSSGSHCANGGGRQTAGDGTLWNKSTSISMMAADDDKTSPERREKARFVIKHMDTIIKGVSSDKVMAIVAMVLPPQWHDKCVDDKKTSEEKMTELYFIIIQDIRGEQNIIATLYDALASHEGELLEKLEHPPKPKGAVGGSPSERTVTDTSLQPKPSCEENDEGFQELHPGVVCGGCGDEVKGHRFMCKVCPVYDLCSTCRSAGQHSEHPMMSFWEPISSTIQEDQYELNSKPTGLCVIIHNEDFKEPESSPCGTDEDADNLARQFSRLGFRVLMCKDLTRIQMLEALEYFSTLKNLADKDLAELQKFSVKEWSSDQFDDLNVEDPPQHGDAFVCCIMSHGEEGVVYGTDGKRLWIHDITVTFSQGYCPALENKPKVFFIEASQYTGPLNVPPDSSAICQVQYIPVDADFVVASYKDKDGSGFMQSVCRQLKDGCDSGDDLMTILRKVYDEMEEPLSPVNPPKVLAFPGAKPGIIMPGAKPGIIMPGAKPGIIMPGAKPEIIMPKARKFTLKKRLVFSHISD